jgi:hypothetical protein
MGCGVWVILPSTSNGNPHSPPLPLPGQSPHRTPFPFGLSSSPSPSSFITAPRLACCSSSAANAKSPTLTYVEGHFVVMVVLGPAIRMAAGWDERGREDRGGIGIIASDVLQLAREADEVGSGRIGGGVVFAGRVGKRLRRRVGGRICSCWSHWDGACLGDPA